MKHIRGLSDIVDDYDTFLLDMWGVLHDGSQPYDGVLTAIRQLKGHPKSKRLIILSNSSKRAKHSVRMLVKLGFDPDDFESIVTSGEVAHELLLSRTHAHNSLDHDIPVTATQSTEEDAVFILGSGDADVDYCRDSGWSLAPSIDQASLLVARGTFTIPHPDQQPQQTSIIIDKRIDGEAVYQQVLQDCLQSAARRKIPMLVCNPDKLRPTNTMDMPPMPGALGDLYEDILGGGSDAQALVERVGKPFANVYDVALGDNDTMDRRSRVIMIGDALETDVLGGLTAGIATLWVVSTGIHGPALRASGQSLEDGAASILASFNERKETTYARGQTICPTYFTSTFTW
jgi:HAD superfamily hydrolase (TIGR01450 family)